MATYLVIHFNRYKTEDSQHHYISAESHKEAITKSFDECDEGFADYIDDMMTVKGHFASISEEESDILSYKLQSVK